MTSKWRLMVAMLAATGVLLGAVTLTIPDVSARIVGGSILAAALFLLCRALVAGVRLTDSHLVHYGYLRTSSTPRQEVVRVAVEVVDSKIVWDVEAPVLHLRDGREQVLSVLSGLQHGSRRDSGRVGVAVCEIQQWLREGPPEE